jgi:hypothetical protein
MNANESTVKVRYPKNRGALRIGDYLPGVAYDVPAKEAERLVKVKGFEYVDAVAPAPSTTSEE